MTLLDVLILLLVAGICGALGQAIAGYSRGGCLVSIALGFVGALLGMWIARLNGPARAIPGPHWWNQFSDRLVDYRLRIVRGSDHTVNS